MIAIVISCVGVCSAYAQDCYLSLNAGATMVDNQNSPMFGLRFGVETALLIGEAEISYLSLRSESEYNEDVVKKNLSTMIAGFNLGIKFLQGERGYLAAMFYNGYSLQEGWYNKYGCCYDYYCGYYDYGCSHYRDYHDGYYVGFGLSGAINISNNIYLFGEARYQNIPVKGRGDDKWGAVVSGGIRFYF